MGTGASSTLKDATQDELKTLVNSLPKAGFELRSPGRVDDMLMIIVTAWWFQRFFIFNFIYGILLPIDELIFFKMVKTTSQVT